MGRGRSTSLALSRVADGSWGHSNSLWDWKSFLISSPFMGWRRKNGSQSGVWESGSPSQGLWC